MRLGILVLALITPGVAAADLDGPGWNVSPSRFRVDPGMLRGQRDERGLLRSPRLTLLFEGARPEGLDTSDETPALGGGLRLSLEIPIVLQVSVGAYVAGGHRGFFNDWEEEFAHFALVDTGGFLRLRTAFRNMVLFVGGHGGHTYFAAFHGSDATNSTWHAGGHAGFFAGFRRVGVELQTGLTARRWRGGDLRYQDHFDHTFVELYGSIGFYFLLGDYR